MSSEQAGYAAFIASARWAELRAQRLELDVHTCQGCGITQAQLTELGWPGLQVHHKNGGPPDYGYPKPLGKEDPATDLLTLCPDCHDGITDSVRRQRYRLSEKKRIPDPNRQVVERDLPRFEEKRDIPVPGVQAQEKERPTFTSNKERIWHGLSKPATEADREERNHPPQWSDRRPAQSLLQGHEGDQR